MSRSRIEELQWHPSHLHGETVLLVRLSAVHVRRAASRLRRQGVSGLAALGAALAAHVAELAREPRGRPRGEVVLGGKMRVRKQVEGSK